MARPAEPLDVLVVARPDDEHADDVAAELGRRRVRFWRNSLNTWRTSDVEWRAGAGLRFRAGQEWVSVTSATTVWWRRPGWIPTEDLEDAEADLTQAEGFALFRGVLFAEHPRWVDEPFMVARSELKPLQLEAAMSAGVNVPQSIITNVPGAAAELLRTGAVAKPASSGPGPAPFVTPVPPNMAPLLSKSPVLLQEWVHATADLRMVALDERVFAWRRPRAHGDAVDWREADPAGTDFALHRDEALSRMALGINSALGLSMSVQDWLETEAGYVFMEVNPQGQWLFLRDAHDLVTPALVDHLTRHE